MDNAIAMAIIVGFGILFFTLDLWGGAFRKAGALSLNEMGVNILSFVNFLGIRAVMTAIWAFVFYTLLGDHKGCSRA
jgi:hypothetical protein